MRKEQEEEKEVRRKLYTHLTHILQILQINIPFIFSEERYVLPVHSDCAIVLLFFYLSYSHFTMSQLDFGFGEAFQSVKRVLYG